MATVDEVFHDFESRRSAIIEALTTDVDKFFHLCEFERGDLCLYGDPDGTWRVVGPNDQVPTYLPRPPHGINHLRDTMDRTEWLYLIANQSDSWLMDVVSFYTAGWNQIMRQEVLRRTCTLPTAYQVVAERFPRTPVVAFM